MSDDTHEIKFTSMDKRVFMMGPHIVSMSETVKSLMGPEDDEEYEPREEAITPPLDIEGVILEFVIEYCNYHNDNKENKENKEDENNTLGSEFRESQRRRHDGLPHPGR